MDASEVVGAVEFQFQDPEDQARYGDRWYRYAEEDLIRLPASKLIELESELGMPVVDVMNAMRRHSTLGDLGVAWIGVRAVNPVLAGDFDSFNPMTLAIRWRPATEVIVGKDQGSTALEVTPDAEDTPPPPVESYPDLAQWDSGPSDQPHTVVLQTLPIAE